MWKVSKYGVFSGSYFPVFGPENTPYLDSFHAVVDYYHQNLNGLVASRVVVQRKTWDLRKWGHFMKTSKLSADIVLI